MRNIITVENISKRYQIGTSHQSTGQSLREALNEFIKRPINRLRNNGYEADNEIWALKDINFAVEQGETIGIIGSNGAGKSTLLKVLSRITEPTTGRIELFGRVGSLLEVGTGFHPELTGRENIFLNGAVMGMKRSEITQKFDEIVAFSEIERFIDTPVKRYSSGMYMRLAFAVAAHLSPEVLIVDEVLAVGDASFQKKCLGKMGDVANEGRTVLFVSHNMAAIQVLCKRVVWLQQGKIAGEGETETVVKNYLGEGAVAAPERVWDDAAVISGNDRVRLRRACVRPVNGSANDNITIRTAFTFEFEYWNFEPDVHLSLSLHLYNDRGVMVFASVPVREPTWHGKAFPAGLFRSVCQVPGDLLNDGLHRALLLIVKNESEVLLRMEDALIFEVFDSVERRGNWHGKWPGTVRPDLDWTTEYLDGDLQKGPR